MILHDFEVDLFTPMPRAASYVRSTIDINKPFNIEGHLLEETLERFSKFIAKMDYCIKQRNYEALLDYTKKEVSHIQDTNYYINNNRGMTDILYGYIPRSERVKLKNYADHEDTNEGLRESEIWQTGWPAVRRY